MNIEGADVEALGRKPFLPALHGCFILGTVRGAVLGILANAASFPVVAHLVLAGVVGAGVVGAGSTHAWVQVYLPGAGWIEFDPTNGTIGNAGLIRVAIARDIETTGNTSAASIPLATHRLLEEHPELSGGLALQIGFGAGLVFGAQVVVLP